MKLILIPVLILTLSGCAQFETPLDLPEAGTIEVVTTPDAACTLYRGENAVLQWTGSKVVPGLPAGKYKVRMKVNPDPPDYEIYIDLPPFGKEKIVFAYASIQITTNVPTSVSKLLYNGQVIKTLSDNGTINNIIPGNYTLTTEAPGYLPETVNISLSSGQILVKNTQLLIQLVAMVPIPAGTFTMGCTSEQSNCYSDESPTHQVTLSAYEISKYEITQKQWRTVMGTSPSYFTGDNRPVEQVSWYDAVNFCNALSTREGLTPAYTINGTNVTCNFNANGYRLPTEAEWEYAARGGASSTNTQYSGSNTIGNVAWYYDNSSSSTHDAGTKSPNQLGIYDMSGNIWEWCWDWYSSNYYSTSPGTNPTGPSSGSRRVLRGGGWSYSAVSCRVANRVNLDPDDWYISIGFRLARTK